MYEFEVLLKNGERTFIWGYNYQDALNRHPKLANEIESLLFQEYIDWPPIWEVSFSQLAVGVRRGQFFVSIGNLHNFPYAFLVNLTKENFPKPLDFLCRL